MNSLINELQKNEKFKQYIKDVESKISPIDISGLSDVGKIQFLATTQKMLKKPICLITYNEIQAKKLIKDLKNFIQEVEYFPKREIVPYDYLTESKDLPYERIEVLNKLHEKKIKILVTTIEALMQKMLPKRDLYKNVLELKVGMFTSLEDLKQKLVLLGFERADLVENKGQFSIRGGIVDVGVLEDKGVRIEFWGDEIDSIRYFALSSQRTIEMTDKITIYPIHEFLVKDLEKICERIQKEYTNAEEDIEIIKNGNYISKIDKYFNKFYPETNDLLDYLEDSTIIVIDEIQKVKQRKENIIIENNNLIKTLIEKEKFVPEAIKNTSEYEYNLKNKQTIYLQANNSYSNINKYEFKYREINFYKSEIELLIADCREWLKNKKKAILFAGTQTNCNKILELLQENEIPCHIKNGLNEIKEGEILLSEGAFSAGFESYDCNLIVVSLEEAFESTSKKRRSSQAFKQGEKVVFADLKNGDYVVHKSHGIGVFIGVNTITADNITKDYIKIKYKNDDILYVPTNNLDNVRKYVGGGEIAPKINKLGSKEWQNTKTRVKKNLQEVAKELIELYAKRQKIKGFSFSKDTEWQKQFENDFPYEETQDQLRCIEETKRDMEKPRPMDRLLCGDVGYRKNRSCN